MNEISRDLKNCLNASNKFAKIKNKFVQVKFWRFLSWQQFGKTQVALVICA